MDRFKNVLVAASPGRLELTALRTAVKLAETNGARLTLLDVVEPVARVRRLMPAGRRTVDGHAEQLRHRMERLRSLAESTRAGDGTEVKVVVGEPCTEVIRHVLEHNNDLVIVGGREVENWATPEFPSGVMQLLRKCPVPVWMMRPPRPDELRILALIDPDPDDPVRDGLNDLVLSLATSLASGEDGELHVGHAREPAIGSSLQSSPSAPSEETDGVQHEQLGELVERHHLAETGASVHLVEGHAGEALSKLADRLRAGLIVMGTVARAGISGFIIGNTAETILQSVHCSVLAVKPEGFVSPVKPAKETVEGRR